MFPPRTPNDGDDSNHDDPLDRLLAAYETAEPFAELRGLDGDEVAPPDDDLSGVVNLAPAPEAMTPGRTSRLAEGAKRREERRLGAEHREAEKRERAHAAARQRERERAERERREAEARDRKQAIVEQRSREHLERAQRAVDRRAQQREERRRQKEEREERRRVEREEREAVELDRAREHAANEEDQRREKELRDVDRREQRRLAQERRARQKDERRRQRREKRERATVEREERKRLLARVREEERREQEHQAFLEAERKRLRKEEAAVGEAAPEVPSPPTPPTPPTTPPTLAPPASPGEVAFPRISFERVRPLPDGWQPSPHGGPQYATVPMPAAAAATTAGTAYRAHVLTPAGRPSAFRLSGGGRDDRPSPRSRRTVATAAAVATAIAASFGGWWYLTQRDRIDHPDHWDPRVYSLVSFVEAERGRAFDHPVAIEVVTAPELEARWADATAPPADLPGDARDTAILRSLGLVDGSPRRGDLAAAMPVSAAGIAFYSPADRSITMTGELDVVTGSALVAALTMALYDQAFGLPAHADQQAERLELVAAIGGAAATQEAYLHTLSPADRATFDVAASMATASTSGPLSELERLRINAARWAHVALARWGPERDGDHLVERPPTTEEQLLAPLAYLLADDAVDVEEPDLEPGERRIASGKLGALHWLVMLAGRVDPMAALSAADGWAGDRWVAFDRDGRTCTRVAWIGDTERDRGEMSEALEQWVAAMPPADGRVTLVGDTLALTSCDPGPDMPVDPAGIEKAAELALARTAGYVPVSALLEAAGPEHGWCLTDAALRRLGSVPEPPVELALTRFLDDAGQRLVVETECV